ncbi:MAG TPA: cation diffusion facilitator family transporter [Solirubrobacteraceae bacterium]|nr:cation diffusion facilitator family transporter [Solirubrobacteraceae bacterium]
MADPQVKTRTAALSIVSNSVLILLKVIASSITGSVAILTEAAHSSIDLVASIVAFFSVRKAGEPADESHRYGHEKVENLSAAIEGILILVGSAAIAFQAIRHLAGLVVGLGARLGDLLGLGLGARLGDLLGLGLGARLGDLPGSGPRRPPLGGHTRPA